MDTTFSDDEKRYILGEMIKNSTIDVPTLVEFIKAHQVRPDWMMMQLPSGAYSRTAFSEYIPLMKAGRNMNQCYNAAEIMFQTKLPEPDFRNVKRKSMSDLVEPPTKRQAMMVPIEPPIAPARIIQPRPPPNGYPPSVPVSISPPVTSTGKKRGRPSKADKEAQARAVYSRLNDYTPITPAPLAPIAIQPQREYASSPGYEISSNPNDQRSKKRGGFGPIDSPQHASSSFPLQSPASTTDTPRALPEPLDQVERATLSPRDRGSVAMDSRSPPLLPHMQHQDSSQALPPLQPRTQPPPPFTHSPRTSHTYEPHRNIDPIFPDRDRTRHMPDQLKEPPPTPVTTVANRG
ncbi:uncharacterized protein F4822DRAFT_424380 [Hypoxylon trugodes]|uniref:uncharacterized protein n=1 Tax=Hypoxylon trugodes TaxID=326681 RepID=UPI00219B8B6A|nr:uncharacterized protein F4822DRAFT_424380 [Hypoxylon trugodes]KAI1393917.1 hypothetical protein F4822DRAFT_424380 [Hypoxylon trugodes]